MHANGTVVGLLPDALARPLARLEPYGMHILIGVIFILPLIAALAAQSLTKGVISAGLLVLWLNSPIPDLVIGALAAGDWLQSGFGGLLDEVVQSPTCFASGTSTTCSSSMALRSAARSLCFSSSICAALFFALRFLSFSSSSKRSKKSRPMPCSSA